MILAFTSTATLTLLLALATGIDLRHHRLPDAITLPLIALGLMLVVATPDLLIQHITAALLAYASLWLVAHAYRRRTGVAGLGLGDAKLFAAAGAWLGPLYLAPLLLTASLLALSTAGLLRLAGKDMSLRTRLPFGPFLSAAFLGCWLLKINNVPLP